LHNMTVPQDIERKATERSNIEFALSQLSDFKRTFDPVLVSFFKEEFSKIGGDIRQEATDLLKEGYEFVLSGGKRLRPAFMYFGYVASGGEPNDSIIKASLSVELFHSGALILDDIIDHSDLRRGRPTVHKVIAENIGDEDLGEGVAIIAGNTLIALAGKSLSSFPADNETMRAARELYDQMGMEINYGQYLDMIGNVTGDVDIDWIMKVMEYKTARYTIEKPLLIGASLAGASKEVLQLHDDILGMFGDEEKVGKPVDSDLKEGKKTLLILETIQRLGISGRVDDIARINSILGNHDLSDQDYKWVQNIIVETDTLNYCREIAEQLIVKSKQSLENVSINPEAKKYLLGIADYMLTREK